MFTDSRGRTWHIMERDDGSISVYYTVEGNPAHYVVYDMTDQENNEAVT